MFATAVEIFLWVFHTTQLWKDVPELQVKSQQTLVIEGQNRNLFRESVYVP